jgi:XTP/dITP diphosphohydrolase
LKLVAASANPDKVKEISAVLGDAGIELLPRPPDIPDVVEDADTLEGNARLKAVAVCAGSGQAAVADDTGLEVDALDGAPGVYSARYAGEDATYADNVAKLLAALDGMPADKRTARFRTVVIVRYPDGDEVVADGWVDGTIATEPHGDHGFGYDPIFVPDGGAGRTFAELAPDEKHAISHRGRALRELARKLADAPH